MLFQSIVSGLLLAAAASASKPGSLEPCKNGLVENAVTGQIFLVHCNQTLVGKTGKYVSVQETDANNCAASCNQDNCCGVQWNYALSRCLQYQTPQGEQNCTSVHAGAAKPNVAAVVFNSFAG